MFMILLQCRTAILDESLDGRGLGITYPDHNMTRRKLKCGGKKCKKSRTEGLMNEIPQFFRNPAIDFWISGIVAVYVLFSSHKPYGK